MKNFLVPLFALLSLQTAADQFPDQPHIYVEGYAEISVQPDEMELSVKVAAEEKFLVKATQKISERSDLLLLICKKLGVDGKDVSTGTLEIDSYSDYGDSEESASVSREINIRLRDLDRYPQLMAALIESGISGVTDTRFIITRENEYMDRTLLLALKNARNKAEKIAAAEGKKIIRVYSVSELNTHSRDLYYYRESRGVSAHPRSMGTDGVSTITPYRTEPFEPGTMFVYVSVFVTYLIQ